MSFRRSALVRIGGFNRLLAYGYDDVDVCCRLVDAGVRIKYVEDALVRHDRAPSETRDGQQVIRDPYSIIYARSVFTLQCEHQTRTGGEILDALVTWAQGWRDLANERLEVGEFSPDQHAAFVLRVDSALEAGLRDGRGPRPRVTLPRRRRRLFKPYRAPS